MTDLEARLTGNLLDPLIFDDWGSVGKFIRDQRCAMCLGCLVPQFAPAGTYTAECPDCGPIYEHNHVHRADVEKIKDNQLTGEFELRHNL